MANNIISEGVKFGSTLKECPQVMTVTSVSDTEVQFTRKGYSGIFMMPIEKFCEIGIVLHEKD